MLIGAASLALMVGLAGFAANTAEWVNVLAHVEKEIQLACVDDEGLVSRDTAGNILDCDYGVVFPENPHTLRVELTLSDSFFDQEVKSGVLFDVFWECKLVDEFAPPSTANPCRETLPDTDPLNLDGSIRDYIVVSAEEGEGCLDELATGPGSGTPGTGAEIDYIGSGGLDQDAQLKCHYVLTFTPPACEGHLNLLTDPAGDPLTVECDEDTTSDDPQDWDISADLGDNFKVQVYDFTFELP
jgi:hypothetical protein